MILAQCSVCFYGSNVLRALLQLTTQLGSLMGGVPSQPPAGLEDSQDYREQQQRAGNCRGNRQG